MSGRRVTVEFTRPRTARRRHAVVTIEGEASVIVGYDRRSAGPDRWRCMACTVTSNAAEDPGCQHIRMAAHAARLNDAAEAANAGMRGKANTGSATKRPDAHSFGGPQSPRVASSPFACVDRPVDNRETQDGGDRSPSSPYSEEENR